MTNSTSKIVLILSSITYLMFGMFLAALGPVLGELSVQAATTLAVVGGILTFLFLGSLIAQIIIGPIIDRFGQKYLLSISLFITSIGIFGFISSRDVFWLFLMAFVSGLGQGGIDIGGNLAVSEAFPKNNTSYLNLLHFFFGVGAFIGPAFISLAISFGGNGLIVHWIIAGVFVVLAVAAIFVMKKISKMDIDKAPMRIKEPEGYKLYFSPLIWLFAGVMLIFFGVEFGLGSWISDYMNKSTGMAIQNGALVTSAYWGALAIGRLVSAVVSRKISRLKLLILATSSSMIGGIGLLLSQGKILPTVICLVWISFSYGTVIPTTVAFATTVFHKNKGKAVGLLSAMGNIGGLSIPWVAGVLLENQSPIIYLGFISFCLGVLLVLVLLIRRSISSMDQGQESMEVSLG